MANREQLSRLLQRIDQRSYNAYKELRGSYDFGEWTLFVDHVQGDPFAAPSRLRARMPWAETGFPAWSADSEPRAHATGDFLTRLIAGRLDRSNQRRGSGKSGLIAIEEPAQEVLARTSVLVEQDRHIEVRFTVGLPAQGRRILGRQAERLLLSDVPALVSAALDFSNIDEALLRSHVHAVEDQHHLREQLGAHRLVAFLADGALLPRQSGVDPRPLAGEVVPLRAPESLRVSFELPHAGVVSGLGIPEGVTLIVGGGFHGKSTVLNAVELGVYDHPPGDGRELCVTRADAVKVRAEDGRRVAGVDISPFIHDLPFEKATDDFWSDDASGSTSQAAAIIEALEVGSRLLLIDEDTSATNFMIRDRRMQELVARDREPITPFLDKASQLWREQRVSTVLVVGGSGDYFDIADTVIRMDAGVPHDDSERAREIASLHPTRRESEGGTTFGAITPRYPVARSIDPSRGKRDRKISVRSTHTLEFGTETIDLRNQSALVESAQLRAIGAALVWLKEGAFANRRSLADALTEFDAALAADGWQQFGRGGDLADVRRFELAIALNRLRSLEVTQNQQRPGAR